VVKMELPAGYNGNAEAETVEFGDEDLKANVWERLDKLALPDVGALVEVFQEANLATREMVDKIIEAQKSGKK